MARFRSIMRHFMQILAYILLFISALGAFSANWMFATWANLRMDELIYTLSTLSGTGGEMMTDYILSCLVPAAAITIAAIAAGIIIAKKRPRRLRLFVCAIALIAVATLGISAGITWHKLDISDFITATNTDSTYIEDNYVSASDVKLRFPEKKRNLIYIFLESTEITFADTASGGAFSQNVIPELTEIALANEDFSGADMTLNGAYVPSGCSWTMAAMFAQTSGLPLKTGIGQNEMNSQKSFFGNITALGDILASEGYNQTLLIGSDATFGGRELYFTEHGNYKLCDYFYAIDNGQIPEDYYVWWGYEDLYLFENAKTELDILSSQEAPFNLTILTVDTHFEDGYVCSRCSNTFANSYSNVYSCASCQVSEFMAWLEQQPYYDNTTVVIVGDHLTMDKDYCSSVDSTYARKVYTAVINSAVTPVSDQRREYSTYDMFPTTLAAMGVKIPGNRLGLGTNLFSDTPTLSERDGYSVIDEEFAKNSKFMDSHASIKLAPEIDYFSDTETIRVSASSLPGIPEDVAYVYLEVYGDNTPTYTYPMEKQADGSYAADADIGFLYDRYGYVTIYALGESGKLYCVTEASGDLAISNRSDLDEYLSELAFLDHHTIIVTVCDEASRRLTPSIYAGLQDLGLTHTLEYHDSYVAIITPDSILEDYSLNSSVVFSGTLPDGSDLYVRSSSYDYGKTCSVMIDGAEYTNKSIGLNFVVYDNESGRVVDQSNFDTFHGVKTVSIASGFKPTSAKIDVKYLPDNECIALYVSGISTDKKANTVIAEVWDENGEKQFYSLTKKSRSKNNWFVTIDAADLGDGEIRINVSALDSESMQYGLGFVSGILSEWDDSGAK